MLSKITLLFTVFFSIPSFSQGSCFVLQSSFFQQKENIVILVLGLVACIFLILFIRLKFKQRYLEFTNRVVNDGNSIVIASDKNGKITYISENIVHILGYKASELLGNGWWEKTIDKKTELENEKEKIVEKFKNEEITTRLIKSKSGIYKWIQWHDKKFNDNLIVGIGQDVTELKELELLQLEKKEKALLRQEIINNINKFQYTENESLFDFIRIILKEASKGIEADIFSLLKYKNQKLNILSLYNSVTNTYKEGDELNEMDYPIYFSSLKAGDIICAENVLENKQTKEFNSGYFQKNNIKSLLDVPIFVNGKLGFVISCKTTTKHKNWDNEDIVYLKAIADIVLISFENGKRKAAEKLIIENENIFRQINETIESVFWLYDQIDHKVIYISPSSEKILGISPEKFYKTNDFWKYYVINDDKAKIFQKHEDLVTQGYYEVEYRILKGNELRWIKEKSYAVYEDDGTSTKNSGICTDITEEKKSQERIKQLSLVAEKTSNAVSISDMEGYVIWVNQSYLDLFEIEETQIVGKKPRDIFINENADLTKKINKLNATDYKVELQVKTKKKNIIWVELNNTVIYDNENHPIQQVEVITDITTRVVNEKEIENQALILEEYTKDLEYQNKLKEKLLEVENLDDVTKNVLKFVNDQIDNVEHLTLLFPDYYEQIFSGMSLQHGKIVRDEFFVHELNCYSRCKLGYIFINEDIEASEIKSSSDLRNIENGLKSYIALPLFYQKDFLAILLIGFADALELNYKQITRLKEACAVFSLSINQLKLKEAIQHKNDDILSSIYYAKNIQTSILPDIKNFSPNFQNVALFYRPKDIVSGDFYWSKDNENYSFLALGDCTGHGVPGAFLTLLGLNLLEQLISIEKRTSPAEILNILDARLFTILNQNTSENVINDGMELGLCVYDKNNNKIIFAGAGLGILYFQKGEEIHVRGKRTAIGEVKQDDFKFEDTEVQIIGDEFFFMATDGYQDQLGGEKYKRFTKNRLINLLNEIKEKDASEQEEILTKTIDAYIGENSQLDDYTVLGFKLLNT